MDTNNNIQKAKNVPPFVRYCSAIIPTMFDDSLSYYEALCALNNFLQTNVIEVINNNANVTEEYIRLTNELKEYVEDYFENLDVQTEINNKLDQMAEDGSLGQIISTYIQPTITNLQGQIDSIEADVEDVKRSYGTPLTAASTDDMTDTSKIYVNTTDGKWYYYDSDSSTWKIGGTYQSVAIASGSVDVGKLNTGFQESYEIGSDWQVGGITAGSGMTNVSNRCRFVKKMYLRKGSYVKWTTTANVNWCWQSWNSLENLDVHDNSGWLTSTEWVVPYDGYFGLCMRYTDNRDLEDADVATLSATLKVYSTIPNHSSSVKSWYSGASTTPIEIKEQLTVEGVANNVEVIVNDNGALYLTLSNGVEYYNQTNWGTQRYDYSRAMKSGNLNEYGTAGISANGRLIFDIVFPNNYMLVLNAITAALNVKFVGDLQDYEIVLARNSAGRLNCGAFREIYNYYTLRSIPVDIEKLNVVDSLAYYNTNVRSVNHRGYNTIAPENTLPAFKLSRKMGFDTVECDVQLTSDNIPVILHDATIDRTSNGSGAIASMTYAQALEYDFGSWKSPVYAGTKIPTLEQFVALCKNLGLKAYIELKSDLEYTQSQINNIVGIVDSYSMMDNVSFISFNADLLQMVKTANDSVRLGLVCSNISGTEISKATLLKSDNNKVFIDCSYGQVDSTKAASCRNGGFELEVWTIDSMSAVNNLDEYVSGFTSNYLNVGRELYKANID